MQDPSAPPHELRDDRAKHVKTAEQMLPSGKGWPFLWRFVPDDLEYEAAFTLYEMSTDPHMVELLMRRYRP